MKKEHIGNNKLWTKKRILTNKTKKSLLGDCCCFSKEFSITGRTSNVCFAKLVLTEKSLKHNTIDSLTCRKKLCVCIWMDG